jgi:hypothetical protein
MPWSDSVTRAVLVSGHVVDAPDRSSPRFPAEQVLWVTERIRDAFAEWEVGAETTVISGGARGADIIAAEEGHARGAHVLVCLALPADEFESRSVSLPDTDWADRFRRVLATAEVRNLSSVTRQVPTGDEVFVRTNEWIVDLARQLDAEPRAIIVWDGQSGDGPGGTADLVRQLGYDLDDPRVRVIDPSPNDGG